MMWRCPVPLDFLLLPGLGDAAQYDNRMLVFVVRRRSGGAVATGAEPVDVWGM